MSDQVSSSQSRTCPAAESDNGIYRRDGVHLIPADLYTGRGPSMPAEPPVPPPTIEDVMAAILALSDRVSNMERHLGRRPGGHR